MYRPIKFHNPNCDGNQCTSPTGEVRVLSYESGGNLIICHSCFDYEMKFRKERNKKLAPDCRYDTPKWEDLKVYENS